MLSAREGASRLVLAGIDQARMEKLADELVSSSVEVDCVPGQDAHIEACRSCDLSFKP